MFGHAMHSLHSACRRGLSQQYIHAGEQVGRYGSVCLCACLCAVHLRYHWLKIPKSHNIQMYSTPYRYTGGRKCTDNFAHHCQKGRQKFAQIYFKGALNTLHHTVTWLLCCVAGRIFNVDDPSQYYTLTYSACLSIHIFLSRSHIAQCTIVTRPRERVE